ncbi:MAG: DUF481 domain-containing protein [Polyangiales bacterium]
MVFSFAVEANAQDDAAAAPPPPPAAPPADLETAAVKAAAPQVGSELITEEKPAETEKAQTTWTANAGGILNSGNTNSFAITAGTNFAWLKDRHGIDAGTIFNVGKTKASRWRDDSTKSIKTMRNWNTRFRYNYFLTDMDAIYAAVRHRWDVFAGLDTRLTIGAGYTRYFIKNDKTKLWGEAGLLYNYDNRTDRTPLGILIAPEVQNTVGARLFAGYENKFNDDVALATGLEIIDNFNKVDDYIYDATDVLVSKDSIKPFEDLRINWNVGLTANLVKNLAASFNFGLYYDNRPVPGFRKVDTVSTFSLIYTLL